MQTAASTYRILRDIIDDLLEEEECRHATLAMGDGVLVSGALVDGHAKMRYRADRLSTGEDYVNPSTARVEARLVEYEDYANALEQLRREVLERGLLARANTLRRAFYRLPVEIMARIFIIAAAAFVDDLCLTPRAISHVNRLFRSVALDTPELWSAVHLWKQTLEEAELWFNRSKTCPIRFSSHVLRNQALAIRELLTKHIHRFSWVKLGFMFRRHFSEFFLGFNRERSIANRLHSLRLSVSSDASDALSFALPWNIPNLIAFEGYNIILEKSSLVNVIRISLTWNMDGESSRILTSLLEALFNLPMHLDQLRMRFYLDTYDHVQIPIPPLFAFLVLQPLT